MSNREKDWTTDLDELFSSWEDSVSIKVTTDTATRVQYGDTLRRKTYETTVSSIMPYVNSTIENTYFKSRYSHFTTWINNLNYTGYPDEKRNGFVSCIGRYMELANNNKNNFKVLDNQITSDFTEYSKEVKNSSADNFLLGYYDALLIIKRVLYQSRLVRYQELTNKIS